MIMPKNDEWEEFLREEQEDMRRKSDRMLISAIGALIALAACVAAILAITHQAHP